MTVNPSTGTVPPAHNSASLSRDLRTRATLGLPLGASAVDAGLCPRRSTAGPEGKSANIVSRDLCIGKLINSWLIYIWQMDFKFLAYKSAHGHALDKAVRFPLYTWLGNRRQAASAANYTNFETYRDLRRIAAPVDICKILHQLHRTTAFNVYKFHYLELVCGRECLLRVRLPGLNTSRCVVVDVGEYWREYWRVRVQQLVIIAASCAMTVAVYIATKNDFPGA